MQAQTVPNTGELMQRLRRSTLRQQELRHRSNTHHPPQSCHETKNPGPGKNTHSLAAMQTSSLLCRRHRHASVQSKRKRPSCTTTRPGWYCNDLYQTYRYRNSASVHGRECGQGGRAGTGVGGRSDGGGADSTHLADRSNGAANASAVVTELNKYLTTGVSVSVSLSNGRAASQFPLDKAAPFPTNGLGLWMTEWVIWVIG